MTHPITITALTSGHTIERHGRGIDQFDCDCARDIPRINVFLSRTPQHCGATIESSRRAKLR